MRTFPLTTHRRPIATLLMLPLLSTSLLGGAVLAGRAAAAQKEARLEVRQETRLEVRQVIANVRKAIGYEQLRAQKKGFQLEGTANVAGIESTFTYLLTPDGRFARSINGRLSSHSAFDGKTAWTRDWSEVTRIIELREREQELASIWLLNGRWLENDGPFNVEIESAAPGSDPKTLNLLLTVKGGLQKERVTLDRSTWLPTVLTDITASEPEIVRLTDWRSALGFKFPHSMEQEAYGEKQTFTVRTVTAAPDFVRSPFQMLPSKASDTAFDAAAPARVEARRARTGHMLVHPRINGQDVGWFILDSGAGAMVISPKVADQLKMPGFGRMTALGVGGPVKTRFREGESIQLGPMTVKKPVYIELDFSQLSPIFGVPIAGLCGYDVFSRSIVSFDVKNGGVELFDPATFKLSTLPADNAGRWNELFLNGRIPVVKAGFEGARQELFTLDTGSNATVTFHTPAVERFKLLDGRKTSSVQAGGVGGFSAMKTGPIDYFELGGKRFEKPVVQFSEAKTGAFTEPYTVGNIGSGFLEGFRLVFNYPDKKIAFLSNESAAKPTPEEPEKK